MEEGEGSNLRVREEEGVIGEDRREGGGDNVIGDDRGR